jgi:hypothetical protein
MRAENCSKCMAMAVEEDFGTTITSIKEDTMCKINPIPYIHVKSLINRNNTLVKEYHDGGNDNNQSDEMYIEDDIGGIEYYNYLEKTVSG